MTTEAATKKVLKGAYVQAWVWVEYVVTPEAREVGDTDPTDEEFRIMAVDSYAQDGEMEFDEDAVVSRSYDGEGD